MPYELYEIEKIQYKPYVPKRKYKDIELSKITGEVAGKAGVIQSMKD